MKKFLSLILVLSLFVGIFPVYAIDEADEDMVEESSDFAAVALASASEYPRSDDDIIASGSCGSETSWALYEDGELYIYGTGPMANYSGWSAPWQTYRKAIKSVVMEDGITSIGSCAFYDLDALTEISLPQSITSIGSSSFSSCNAIRMTIPENVTTIGSYAFQSCSKLEMILIPDTVTTIGYGVFSGCPSLSDVFYPGASNSGIKIGSNNDNLSNAYWHYGYDGSKIVSLVSANSWLTLPCKYAIRGETLQNAVTVGARPGYMFTSLSIDHGSAEDLMVTIDADGDFDTVTIGVVFTLADEREITESGFCGRYNVESVKWILYSDGELYIYGKGAMWENSWSSYYDAPWYSYRSQISSLTIASGVTTIPDWAFYDCSSLTNVTIPDSVTSIGECAFYDCSSLTNVTIPDSVTSIGEDAFCNCSSLARVTIPDGVTSIGRGTFHGCSSLTSVTIPDNVTSIGERAFYYCSSLTSVTIPDSVTSIGGYAFSDCSSLNNVEFLGNAPSTVGSWAFPDQSAGQFIIYYHSGTTGWTTPTWNGYYTACIDGAVSEYSVLDSDNRNSQNILFKLNDSGHTATVGDNSTDDNNSGYSGNNGGVAVIPATVTKDGKTYRVIGVNQYAFSGNRLLTTVEIGANVTSVDPTAFMNCTSLTGFSVSAGNTYYKEDGGILYDTSKYNLYVYPSGKQGETFTVPDSVATIGANAFSGNSYLKEVVVPSTVTSIGSGAFKGCSLEKITLRYIGGSLNSTQVFSYVFESSYYVPSSLKEVTITGGKLHSRSFYGCTYIETISLPGNDTMIPSECFYGCNSLKSLRFSDVADIYEDGNLVIPSRITAIGNCAFAGCTSITEYRVAEDNPYLYSDQWGVLYSKDKTTLYAYPSARKWPYYNVADETTTICRYAFYSCANLVNLYIPKTVTAMESSAITDCPGMTVCAYLNSTAYAYAGNNNIPSWAMDNYRIQGIEIYALPENTVAVMGQEDFSDLYVTVNVGKVLQLDSYSLSYNAQQSGVQTATVSYEGKTATFDILLYRANTEHVVDFGPVDFADGTTGYVAMYNTSGKMVRVENAAVLNGHVQIVISDSVLATLRDAKLFILNSRTNAPVSEPIVRTKQEIVSSST